MPSTPMKHLSFKILALCILVPPLLYTFTLNALEVHLQQRYHDELQAAYTGNADQLLNGGLRIEQLIKSKIDAFLQKKWLLRTGLIAQVIVKTKQGALIYPPPFESMQSGWQTPDLLSQASSNYRILSQGLSLEVSVKIAHNTLLSNAILIFYIITSVTALWYFYRAGIRKSQAEAEKNQSEIEHLLNLKTEMELNLRTLEQQQTGLETQLTHMRQELQTEKSKANAIENEMIEELAFLEDKFDQKKKHQEILQNEITELKEKLERLDEDRYARITNKAAETTAHRFSVLYKQLNINERAIKGFIALPDDIKIKAEELIQQLNYEPDKVVVKRKVFAKKNSATVLETIFAYKGRLYFRKSANQVELLTIGTKHTQNKDLAFLEKI